MTPLKLRTRSSGILLHPTSLPGPHGIGDLGPAAARFADFLSESGQTWWQIFPMGPTGYGNSPYQTLSAFAGNPLLLSLHKLEEQRLLEPVDLRPARNLGTVRVDYAAAGRFKEARLRKAFAAFKKSRGRGHLKFESFCADNESWLTDYAFFSALKKQFRGVSWDRWPLEFRLRKPFALQKVKKELNDEIHYHQFLQFQFFLQWTELKTYCLNFGIGFIGDVPIFVSHDSADVWAHPSLFWLDENGKPTVVAGVPPDYFSRTGQLWGNPLYRWAILRERGYDWWIERFRTSFRRFEAVRLDHFIGFHRYWEVAASASTAEKGRYVEGQCAHFFEKVFTALGDVDFIAEDLGVVTPEVKALRDKFGMPGMCVLQFAFGNDAEAKQYLPHNYIRRRVVYTGTHDNDTTVGWFRDRGSASSTRSKKGIEKERAFALRYMNSPGREIHWDMMRLAWMSVADTAIAPAQDVLGLGSAARMNIPGTTKGNWTWRLKEGQLDSKIARRLKEMTHAYSRTT